MIYEKESDDEEEEIQIEDLKLAPPKMEDNKPQVWKRSTSALWKSRGLLISVLSYPLS